MGLFNKKEVTADKTRILNIPRVIQQLTPDFEDKDDCIIGERAILNAIMLGDIAGSMGVRERVKTDAIWNDEALVYSNLSILAKAIMDETMEIVFESQDISLRKKYEAYSNALKRAYKANDDLEFDEKFELWAKDEMRPSELLTYKSMDATGAARALTIGTIAENIRDAVELAVLSALPTNGHPEGIKGAAVCTSIVYMLSHGADKKEVVELAKRFYKKKDKNAIPAGVLMETLKNDKKISKLPLAQVVVPEALSCFIDGHDYISTVKNALSFEGDNSLIAAIAGAFAVAYYGETLLNDTKILSQYIDISTMR